MGSMVDLVTITLNLNFCTEKLKYNLCKEVAMEQITIQIRDKRKARALSTFLKSLDYIEKVTIANIKLPAKPQPSKADFFALAGIWSAQDVSIESLRSSAWARHM